MTDSPNHDVYFVPGLHRGLRVLEILASADKPMSLSEIARALEVSRSSAFRLVYTLRRLHFLKETEGKGGYVLGPRVLNLGFAYLNQQPITEIARPHLQALRDEVGVSTHLSILEGRDVLYLGSHQARGMYVSNLRTGVRTDAYASAIGWVLLGALDEAGFDAFCEGLEMRPFTEHTPTSAAALRERIDAALATGFVASRGFRDAGGASVAAPVRDHSGAIVACVSISGPSSAFELEALDTRYAAAVTAAAQRVSSDLGHRGAPKTAGDLE